MRATLNVRFLNQSSVVQSTMNHLYLIYYSSPLRLPLQGTSNYSRTLPEALLILKHHKNDKTSYSLRDNHDYLSGPTPDTIDFNSSSSFQNCIRAEGDKYNQFNGTWNVETIDSTPPDRLTVPQLTKSHLQFGQATYSQMPSFISAATLWTREGIDDRKMVIQKCPSVLSAPPSSRQIYSKLPLPDTNQAFVSIDVVLFRTKPVLHCIDNRPNWSETGLLRS